MPTQSSPVQTPSSSSQEQLPSIQPTSTPAPSAAGEVSYELKDSTYQNFQALLSEKKDVYAITWAHDQSTAAFVVGDPLSMSGPMFLWKVGQEKPVKIIGVVTRIISFIWAPNDAYVLADVETRMNGSERIRVDCRRTG